MKKCWNNKGFTLIELVLTFTILLLVLQVVYSVFFVGQKSYFVSTNSGFAQQGVRLGNIFISDDLKYATRLNIGDPASLMTDYYSIRYDASSSELIWEKFSPENIDAEGNAVESKRIQGEWEEIIITNFEPGVLSINMTQVETMGNLESDYHLDFDVELVNAPTLLIDVNNEWNLINGDVILYTKKERSSFGSVNVEWESDTNTGIGGDSNLLTWGELDLWTEDNKGDLTLVTFDEQKKAYVVGNNATIIYSQKYANNNEVNYINVTANHIVSNVDEGIITGKYTTSNSIEYVVINIEGQDSEGNSTGSIYRSIKLIKN